MTEATITRGAKAKRVLSGAVLTGVATAILATAANPAMAANNFSGDPDFTGPSTNFVTDDQGGVNNATMYGAYIMTGGPAEGEKVYCHDAGLDWPYANAYDADSKSSVNAPRLAAVFAEYEDRDMGSKAKNMARDIAMSAYVKQTKEIRHRHIVDTYSPKAVTNGLGWNDESSNIKDIGRNTFYNTVLPQAQTYYEDMLTIKAVTAPKKLGISIDTEKETVRVTLTDSDGNAKGGHKANVKISGATFADGKTTKTITTGSKATTLDIDINKAGTIKADVDVKNIPSDRVSRWSPKDYDKEDYDRYSVQEIVHPEERFSLSASTQEKVEAGKPKVITTINDQDLAPGDFVYDNFKVSGLVGDDKIDVHHELWYSPVKPEQTTKSPQDGHIKIGEITSKGVGNGQHRTDETAQLIQIPEDLPQGGYFYFYEEAPETPKSDGWKGEYGLPDETGFVPFKPSGQTQISQQEADTLPIEIHDDGRITGGMPGMEMPVTLQAYKDADCTIEQQPEVPEDAELLGTTVINVTFDENGEATYQTDKLELAESLVAEGECAAVTIVETLPKTDYTEPKISDYGIPEESIIIERPEAPEEPPAPTPEPDEPEPTPEPDEPQPEPDEPQPEPDKPKPEPKPDNPVVKTGATDRGNALTTTLHNVMSALGGLVK